MQVIIITTRIINNRAKADNVAMPSTVSIHQIMKVGITLMGLKTVKSGPRRPSLGFPEILKVRIKSSEIALNDCLNETS